MAPRNKTSKVKTTNIKVPKSSQIPKRKTQNKKVTSKSKDETLSKAKQLKNAKKLDKIMLANEVARAQLIKRKPVIVNILQETNLVRSPKRKQVSIEKPQSAKKKRAIHNISQETIMLETPKKKQISIEKVQSTKQKPVIDDVLQETTVMRSPKKKQSSVEKAQSAKWKSEIDTLQETNLLEKKKATKKKSNSMKVVSSNKVDVDLQKTRKRAPNKLPDDTIKKTGKKTLIKLQRDTITKMDKKSTNKLQQKKPEKKQNGIKDTRDTTMTRKSIKVLNIVNQKGNKTKAVHFPMSKTRKEKSELFETARGKDPNILKNATELNQVLFDNVISKIELTNTVHNSSEKRITEEKNVGPIYSPRSITTNTSDCLSWTKDISDSSTVTCVTITSNDFVRIDGKLPIIKLTNIDNKISKNDNKDDHVLETDNTQENYKSYHPEKEDSLQLDVNSRQSLSDTDSSDDESSSCTSKETGSSTPNINSASHFLNLSTTSESPSSHGNDVNKFQELYKVFQKSQQSLDLEILNWIGYENESPDDNNNVKIYQKKIFNILEDESMLMVQCQQLKKCFSNYEDKTIDVDKDTGSKTQVQVEPQKSVSEKTTAEDGFKENVSFFLENNNHTLDQSHNDDDALSLFAESITGIESIKLNSSAASVPNANTDFEEYIPQPITKSAVISKEKFTYCPSRIISTVKEPAIDQNNTKPICEKQNADSTSINRESDNHGGNAKGHVENFVSPSVNRIFHERFSINPVDNNTTSPCLVTTCFKPLPVVKSRVFRGVCVFNLIGNCRLQQCNFPHQLLTVDEVKYRLKTLTEEQFIQEYITTRWWPIIRRTYGLCFVEECINRDLLRILIEMAIDFIVKANIHSKEDQSLKVEVVERTLLLLNQVDLNMCKDLLVFSIAEGLLLCDIFIQILANTQNFSRFKLVFKKLTYFIVDIGRKFDLGVASQILERVCILPYEEPVARAVLRIIGHTKLKIFENPKMAQFENTLKSVNKDLHKELILIKNQLDVSQLEIQNDSCVASPKINPDILDQANSTLAQLECEKRYTSPDTTNLDNLNKITESTVVKRNVDAMQTRPFGFLQRTISNNNLGSTSVSSDIGDYRSQNKTSKEKPFENWRKKTIFNNVQRLMRESTMDRPYRHVGRGVHRHLMLGGSPSKFKRQGPYFPRKYKDEDLH